MPRDDDEEYVASDTENDTRTHRPSLRKFESRPPTPRPTSRASLPHHTQRPKPLVPIFQKFVTDPDASLLIGVDFGSSKCALTRAFQWRNTTPVDIHVVDIEFKDEALLSTLIGFHKHHAKAGPKKGSRQVRIVHGSEVLLEKVQDPSRRDFLIDLHQEHARIVDYIKGVPAFVVHEWRERVPLNTLDSLEDVARVFFGLLLLDAKLEIQLHSNMTREAIEALFAGEHANPLGRKIRAGVAIPEMWTDQRMKLYTLMTDAGWPAKLEILSEAKCAAASVLREKIEELKKGREGLDPSTDSLQKDVLEVYGTNRLLHIIDRGGHTLDQSTMKIVVQNGFTRFKPIVESTSTPDGGDRANDEFRRILPNLFGNSWRSIVESAVRTLSDFRFKYCFMSSFEQQKRNVHAKPPGDREAILYDNDDHQLPEADNGRIHWRAHALEFPKKYLRECVSNPVQAILAPSGPLQRHHDATKAIAEDSDIFMIATGGGSKDPEFRKEVQKKYPDTSFEAIAHHAQSYVARGIIVNLLDTEICNDSRLINKSYGIVFCADFDPDNANHRAREHEATTMTAHLRRESIEGKRQLENTVDWLKRQGERTNAEHTTIAMSAQIHTDGIHPDDLIEPLRFEIEIVETEDASLSSNGVSASTEGIRKAGTWQLRISKHLAKRIGRKLEESIDGFVQHVGFEDDWQLEFDYKLCYRWAGMIQFFEIHIPYGGYFPEDRELRQKDMYIARYQLGGDVKMAADAGNDA